MKSICTFLSAFMLLSCSICIAQDDAYKEQIDKMITESESLDNFLKTNVADFGTFDKWLKDFKKLAEKFEKDFSAAYKEKKSFKAVKESVNGLSLAWGMLHRAKYAEEQYQESITLNQVGYAHKWKSTAAEERKKALDTIAQALESLKKSKDLLQEE